MKKLSNTNNCRKKVAAYILAGTLLFNSGLLITNVEAIDNAEVMNVDYPRSELTEVNTFIYCGVNIFVNERSVVPTDEQGNEVPAFLCNGTTYLPARAIAKVFGAKIEWDDSIKSVFIGERGNTIDYGIPKRETILKSSKVTMYKGVNIYVNNELYIPLDEQNNPVDVFIYNGTTYLPVRAISNLYNTNIAWDNYISSVYIGDYEEKNYYHPTMDNTIEELRAMLLDAFSRWTEYRQLADSYLENNYTPIAIYRDECTTKISEMVPSDSEIYEKYYGIMWDILYEYGAAHYVFKQPQKFTFTSIYLTFEDFVNNIDQLNNKEDLIMYVNSAQANATRTLNCLNVFSPIIKEYYYNKIDQIMEEFNKECRTLGIL